MCVCCMNVQVHAYLYEEASQHFGGSPILGQPHICSETQAFISAHSSQMNPNGTVVNLLRYAFQLPSTGIESVDSCCGGKQTVPDSLCVPLKDLQAGFIPKSNQAVGTLEMPLYSENDINSRMKLLRSRFSLLCPNVSRFPRLYISR